MKQTEQRWTRYAVLAVFLLTTLLLAVVNCVNFTVASEDADRITELLAWQNGTFSSNAAKYGTRPTDFAPTGPGDRELQGSLRYFTVSFPAHEGKAELVSFHISSVTEEEAVRWAEGLIRENTGWTRGSYRYRVFTDRGKIYVTVIDYGREMQGCYRILLVSAIGDLVCLVLSALLLQALSRRIFAPLLEAQRRERQFLSKAERNFLLPLNAIDADTEALERIHGPDEHSRGIHAQVRQLRTMADRLRPQMDTDTAGRREPDLSALLRAALDRRGEALRAKGIDLHTEIAPEANIQADPEAMERMLDEILDNIERYALSRASLRLQSEGGRVQLWAENDAALPDGPADAALDRFTWLENANPAASAGLGLSYVKDIVKAHNGRVSAHVTDGSFCLRIAF